MIKYTLRYRLKWYLMAVSILSSLSLSAQDFRQALLKMQKENGDAQQLHVIMTIKAFDNKSSKEAFYHQMAEIKKDQQNYFSRFADTEMLLNSKYVVMVTHATKRIVLNRRVINSESEFKDPLRLNLDSLLTAYGKSSYVGEKENLAHYRITHPKGSIGYTDMFFATQTNQLKKIEYYYKQGQRVTIDIDLFDKQPTFSPETFDESEYFVNKNGKLEPTPAYFQYKIVDAVDQKKNQQ